MINLHPGRLARGLIDAALANYRITNNTTPLSAPTGGIFYKINGSTTAGIIDNFSISQNRATYLGLESCVCSVVGSVTVDTVTNNVYTLKVAKNGTVNGAQSVIRAKNHSSVPCPIDDFFTLTTGDYIEIFISSDVNDSSILVTDMSIIIARIN